MSTHQTSPRPATHLGATPATATPKHPRRCNADYRWTAKKVTAFLRALAQHGQVAQAAREVGMSRQAAYALKARLADPQFQQMWAMARRSGWIARQQAREQAQAEALVATAKWGAAGLAAFAHLRGAGGSGGSGGAAEAPATLAKADTLPPQADTLARKVTF